MTRLNAQPGPRGGFTLLEMLIVIGIIAFLISISAVFYANFVERARQTATAATIQKIHEQLGQRIEAFGRAMDKENLNQAITRMQAAAAGMSPKAAEILVRKDRFRDAFPQQFAELYGLDGGPGAAGTDDDTANGTDDLGEIGYPNTDDLLIAAKIRESFTAPANHDPVTASAELLYVMLTQASVFGISPVDSSEFSTREVRDTDGDGLMEFVDAWGRPLRFYRWPTRLIRPDADGDGTADGLNRILADLLIKGLPAPPASGANERDQLATDPDDLIGQLTTGSTVPLGTVFNETNYHTPGTYHVPLIVSVGTDEELGLYEPYDTANFGHLAQPVDPTNLDPLTDNITNRNQRAGGN